MKTKNNMAIGEMEICIIKQNTDEYISLTDMAKYRNPDATGIIIANWLRTRYTLDYMGIWEKMMNPQFNVIEFDNIKAESGVQSFGMTTTQWVSKTNAIGIFSTRGRNGGTYAHKDIAFEFATWLSPEFKFHLVQEYQRLKQAEQSRHSLEWNLSRTLAKINYRIHTDAVKEHIIPPEVTKEQVRAYYADEADLLNVALFGQTAAQWRNKHPELVKQGNMRDFASLEQLIVLSNLESINAMLVADELASNVRIVKLNKTAITQLKSLYNSHPVQTMKKLDG